MFVGHRGVGMNRPPSQNEVRLTAAKGSAIQRVLCKIICILPQPEYTEHIQQETGFPWLWATISVASIC